MEPKNQRFSHFNFDHNDIPVKNLFMETLKTFFELRSAPNILLTAVKSNLSMSFTEALEYVGKMRADTSQLMSELGTKVTFSGRGIDWSTTKALPRTTET